MMGLLSFCIGVANLLGALEIFFVVSALTLQQTVSLHALAALVLLLPAIALHSPYMAATVATGPAGCVRPVAAKMVRRYIQLGLTSRQGGKERSCR